MNRRNAMKSLGLLAGNAMFPAVLAGFLQRCQSPPTEPYRPQFFSADEHRWVRTILDIILPRTETASATETHTDEFLDQAFFHCLDAEQQKKMRAGLKMLIPQLQAASKEAHLEILNDVDLAMFVADSVRKLDNDTRSALERLNKIIDDPKSRKLLDKISADE